MNVRTRNAVMAGFVLTIGVMAVGPAMANGDGNEQKNVISQALQAGKQGLDLLGDRKAFLVEQKKKIGQFLKDQNGAMGKLLEICGKESDPQKVLQMVKDKYGKMLIERTKFFEGIVGDRQAFLASMVKKYNLGTEEQKKLAGKLKSRMEKMMAIGAKRDKIFTDVISGLEKKDNLTVEEITSALGKLHFGAGKAGHKGGLGKAKKGCECKKQEQAQAECNGGICDKIKRACGNCIQ